MADVEGVENVEGQILLDATQGRAWTVSSKPLEPIRTRMCCPSAGRQTTRSAGSAATATSTPSRSASTPSSPKGSVDSTSPGHWPDLRGRQQPGPPPPAVPRCCDPQNRRSSSHRFWSLRSATWSVRTWVQQQRPTSPGCCARTFWDAGSETPGARRSAPRAVDLRERTPDASRRAGGARFSIMGGCRRSGERAEGRAGGHLTLDPAGVHIDRVTGGS